VKWHRTLEESLPYDVIKDGQFSQMSCYNISPEKIKGDALKLFISSAEEVNTSSHVVEANNFVLIINEINRLDREIEGVHLGQFLKAINDRIEWMFDRDHQIGHSFLTSAKTLGDLDIALREKIIPLLTEYFYEDWEKVCVALNDTSNQFVAKEKLNAPNMQGADEEERYRYTVNSEPFPLEAYRAAYQS